MKALSFPSIYERKNTYVILSRLNISPSYRYLKAISKNFPPIMKFLARGFLHRARKLSPAEVKKSEQPC